MNDMITPVVAEPRYLIDVNWEQAMSRRPRILQIAENLPPYLLMPEVQLILKATLNGHLNLLVDTIWHTGARIGEVIALTPKSFHLNGVNDSDVVLKTLKQRGRGRPKQGVRTTTPKRLVPLADPVYLDKVRRHFATHRPNPGERLFPYTDRYYRRLLAEVIEGMKVKPLIPVTLKTFRHSFAINAIYHGRDIRLIQRWLGHTSLESTMIYTKVLAGETHHLMRDVRYQ